MDKKLMMMALAAGMAPLHGFDDNTQEFKLGKGCTPNKYIPHQGKQECARRLKVSSPAWHSSQNYAN